LFCLKNNYTMFDQEDQVNYSSASSDSVSFSRSALMSTAF
jgi:hypothetical protein